MNIKRAKEEIKNCIEAYLLKDGHGEYVLPAVRQRPVLLMALPESVKPKSWNRLRENARLGWYPIRLPTIRGRAPSVFLILWRKNTEDGRVP